MRKTKTKKKKKTHSEDEINGEIKDRINQRYQEPF